MTRDQGLAFTAAAAFAAAAFITAATYAVAPVAPAAPVAPVARPAGTTPPATAPATQPKALSENAQNGIKWLLAHQNPNDGGWAQGEESQAMGNGMDVIRDKSNVGDTCMAVLALLRTGSSPTAGPYAANIRKGIDFVVSEISKSPGEGLTVTSVNGTRIQTKLGPNIDTFLASLMLGEIRNQVPEASHKEVIAALDKVMDKIEKNQKSDGRVADGGWAPSLAQGIAAKGANVAVTNGAKVSEGTLENFEKFSSARQVAAATPAAPVTGVPGSISVSGTATFAGGIVGGGGAGGARGYSSGGILVTSDDAGVPLYAQASNLSSLQNAQDRLDSKAEQLKVQLDAPATAPADKDKLRSELKDIEVRRDNNGRNLRAATDAVADSVKDDRFIAGFGSNGGEEFLSYLNLGETLIKQRNEAGKGGEAWKAWDDKMTNNLNNIQNKDGSWSGQHCITGRTFCTSAALLVLTLDRETSQVGEQIKKR